jgi:hypothetical protein
MAKIDLNGVVAEVWPVTTVGANNTQKQSIILTVKGYTNQFGEQQGPDEQWQLDVLGTRVEKLKLSAQTHLNQKAKCIVYVRSKKYVTPENKVMYIVSADLAEIQTFGEVRQAPAPMPVAEGAGTPDDDDLPF